MDQRTLGMCVLMLASGVMDMTLVRKNSHGGFREGGRLQASASSGMMRACCTWCALLPA